MNEHPEHLLAVLLCQRRECTVNRSVCSTGGICNKNWEETWKRESFVKSVWSEGHFFLFRFFVTLMLHNINVKFQKRSLSTPTTPFNPKSSPLLFPPITQPPCPYSSSLHKSSGCILKGAKIFTLSKVVKGFCVHTGADKEEAPSAWPKENCWNKSAHTKTQRDNGAGAGPDPDTETHCTSEHRTHRHIYTAPGWEQSRHIDDFFFFFGVHVVQDIQYQKRKNIITPLLLCATL